MKFIFLCLLPIVVVAQKPYQQKIKTGDLLFQNLDCGPLCDAIETVTEGYNAQKFSHIGLAYSRKDSMYIIEAIGKDVHLTSLQEFMARTNHPTIIARLKKQYQYLIPATIQEALKHLGASYDDAFIYNNGKYYCSELIYDAFKKANNNKPFFKLEPMTFKDPATHQFFPAWVDYYKSLNMDIPEGKPGINPGGISKSNKIMIIE